MYRRKVEEASGPVRYHEATYDPSSEGETYSFQRDDLRPHEHGTLWTAIVTWRLELVSLVFAIGFLIAIFLTLDHYNGRDVPDWPVSLNLNSLVALYSTALRALLLFPVAEVISQEKWFWFQRPRPLQHLDAFDLGSRGIWGCAKLLVFAYSSTVPFVAATTTIVLLAIGPFTQQAVRTTLCTRVIDVPDAARLPVAFKLPVDEVTGDGFGQAVAISAESTNSVLAGLTNPDFMASPNNLGFNCPTGNCTFPAFGGITHSSMGMCSQCEDLTSLISQSSCPTVSRGFTGGAEPFDDYITCNLTFSPPASPAVSIPLADVPIGVRSTGSNTQPYNMFNISILMRSLAGCEGYRGEGGCREIPNLPGIRNERYFNFTAIGAKCSLFPCIRHYAGEVRNGQLMETVVSSSRMDGTIRNSATSMHLAGAANPCIVDNTVYDSSNMSLAISKYGHQEVNMTTSVNTTARYQVPKACLYKVDSNWMKLLGRRINETFHGECRRIGASRVSSAHLRMVCSQQYWLSMLYQDDTATFESISKRLVDVATSITNRIRSVGFTWQANDTSNSTILSDRAFVTGTTTATSVCIQFEWRWLSLATSLTFMTFGLLLVSIFRTYAKRSASWKSSALPLLFHGFQGNVEGIPPDHRMTLPEMKRMARGMVVHFADDDNGRYGIVLDQSRWQASDRATK